ncbi:MFS transporter, partial [Candidatus Woesearchaeota archaeon]|nr:MFS transporter [Candidatus Woesearchaeota archaeon]
MSFEKEIKYFVYTGGIWSLYNALTSTFLSLFALSLGASNLVIGLIGSIPYIGALLAELPGAKLLDYFSRKSLIMFSTAIRILWVVIAVAPILLKENVLLTIIITYFLLCLLDYVSDPAWFSFLGDIVPEKTRGSYFGKRLMLMGVLGALGQVIGGQFLMLFPTIQGFSGMFLMGAIIGVSSFILYLHVEEPKYEDSQHHKLKDFFIMDKKVIKFSIFVAVFNFGYMLAAPFFSIFMIKTLGISYAWFGVLTALQIITKLLAQRHMGKICDLYGDKPVAVITSFGTALIPLAFLLALKFGAWFVIPAQLL